MEQLVKFEYRLHLRYQNAISYCSDFDSCTVVISVIFKMWIPFSRKALLPKHGAWGQQTTSSSQQIEAPPQRLKASSQGMRSCPSWGISNLGTGRSNAGYSDEQFPTRAAQRLARAVKPAGIKV